MDLVTVHHRALQATTSIVANVGADAFGLPTPCERFDVRTLINHMIAGNHRFLAVALGEPAESVPAMGDFVDQDALGPYRESADALAKAWSEPAALARTARLPIGDVPGIVALGVHTVETVTHGWDLAKATGQPTEVDAELCAVAWEYAQGIDDSLRGPNGRFGPPIAVPAEASATDTLMAWLGRQP